VEYLQLWEALLTVELQSEDHDTHSRRFTENKQYSAKVAYEGLFWGRFSLSIMKGFGKPWPLQSVSISYS
jgi:hypothetical protein